MCFPAYTSEGRRESKLVRQGLKDFERLRKEQRREREERREGRGRAEQKRQRGWQRRQGFFYLLSRLVCLHVSVEVLDRSFRWGRCMEGREWGCVTGESSRVSAGRIKCQSAISAGSSTQSAQD